MNILHWKTVHSFAHSKAKYRNVIIILTIESNTNLNDK